MFCDHNTRQPSIVAQKAHSAKHVKDLLSEVNPFNRITDKVVGVSRAQTYLKALMKDSVNFTVDSHDHKRMVNRKPNLKRKKEVQHHLEYMHKEF